MNILPWKPGIHIIAGTTLRDNTQKEANDMALHTNHEETLILHNRQALSKQLGIPLNQWVFSQQTHSDHLHEVTKEDVGKGAFSQMEAIKDCDALYTKEKNIAIGVFHADCVPVLLYDPSTSIICAIHSGWQGTIKAITYKSVQYLITKENIDVQQLKAYIGPAISFSSFEVGNEVVEQLYHLHFDPSAFIQAKNNGKYLMDNKGLNEYMLLESGVLKENITIDQNDTWMSNEALFSYRRDPSCGRHLSFIYQH